MGQVAVDWLVPLCVFLPVTNDEKNVPAIRSLKVSRMKGKKVTTRLVLNSVSSNTGSVSP